MTRKQRQLLDFIIAFTDEHGFSPSCDEMKDALGLASKSGINRLVTALVEQGWVRRLHHRARGVEVVTRPAPVVGPYTIEALRKLASDDLYALIDAADTILEVRDALIEGRASA